MRKEAVVFFIGNEHINIRVREVGKERSLEMRITSNTSKMDVVEKDRVVMLSRLNHFKKSGVVIKGDAERIRNLILRDTMEV